ncbi:MAG: hypothetical protein NTX61_01780 [Bacteroidetes bacterium]|nr:hypothetical protein [Bacteroidota bacterium]
MKTPSLLVRVHFREFFTEILQNGSDECVFESFTFPEILLCEKEFVE